MYVCHPNELLPVERTLDESPEGVRVPMEPINKGRAVIDTEDDNFSQLLDLRTQWVSNTSKF